MRAAQVEERRKLRRLRGPQPSAIERPFHAMAVRREQFDRIDHGLGEQSGAPRFDRAHAGAHVVGLHQRPGSIVNQHGVAVRRYCSEREAHAGLARLTAGDNRAFETRRVCRR